MKVGHFTDTYFPQVNGVSYTIKPWKQELERKGVRVMVYFPKGNGYVPQKNEFPLPAFKFPLYKDYRISIPLGITKLSKDLDLVHIHTQFVMAAAAWHISKRYNIPKIFTYHTPVEMYNFYFSRNRLISDKLTKLYLNWENRLLNSCNLVTVGSNYMKDYLRKKKIKTRIDVVPNGIDVKIFKQLNRQKCRKKFGVQSDKVIGYCGRIGYEKHLEDLINIAPSFEGEILIAGDGPAVEFYKNMAKKYANVRFLDFIEQKKLPEFYSCLDVFINPSTVETLSLVSIEAMACGVPNVAADALALKETIENGKTGFLYRPGNKEELLKKIKKVYENREKLAKNCKKRAKLCTYEKAAKRLLELYEEIYESEFSC